MKHFFKSIQPKPFRAKNRNTNLNLDKRTFVEPNNVDKEKPKLADECGNLLRKVMVNHSPSGTRFKRVPEGEKSARLKVFIRK